MPPNQTQPSNPSRADHGPCPNPEDLKAFLEERLDESSEQKWQQHVGSCDVCRRRLESIAADEAMWDGIRDRDLSLTEPNKTDGSDELYGLLDLLMPSENPDYLARIGPYEITGVIGRGSTGIVLKAFETRLNRFVAIKVLAPALAASGPARVRFEREGRAVAAVTHQNVVPVFAVDEFRGLPYLVMRYIPGPSLRQRLEKHGPLTTCEVARVGHQIANGLAAAHAQGIIHRDVKPANVLLENTLERAVVTDFGLARVTSEATMTHSGTISGTPQFMSPEQARGESVDPRSDLFSLGGLMYMASTAQAPFRADTVFGIIHRVCETEPRPIRESNPEIATWMVDFIGVLMAKDPANRFNSALEVAELLESELAHLQNPTSIPQPKRTWQPAPVQPAPVQPTPVQPNELAPKESSASTRWTTGILLASVIAIGGYLFAPVMDDPKGPGEPPAANGTETKPSDQGGAAQAAAPIDNIDTEDSTVEPTRLIRHAAEISPDDEREVSWMVRSDDQQSVTQTYEQRIDQAFKVQPGDRVVLDADLGVVEVRQSELDHASVVVLCRVTAASQSEAEKIASYHSLNVDNLGNTLQLTTKIDEAFLARGGGDKLEKLVVGISIPMGVDVEVATKRGDVTVDSMNANVRVKTGYGGIRFGKIQGDVWARSTAGGIQAVEGTTGQLDLMSKHGGICLDKATGSARLRASDGNIYLLHNSGKVSAHATGGDVRIRSLQCETKAHVEVGQVFVRLTDPPTADAKLSVSGGDVVVHLPGQSEVDFRTKGDIESELNWEQESESDSASAWRTTRLNGGGSTMQLVATSGKIRIEESDDAPLTESLGGSGDLVSLGGSGNYSTRTKASAAALAKTRGEPRPGAMVPVKIDDGQNIDGYTLYLPVSYQADAEQRYPVILYLQGGYGVGGPIERLNDWGLPRLLRDESELDSERNRLLLDRFIVVSLHIQNGGYDDHPNVIRSILESVGKDYRVDDRRIYVTGLSRGGHASWGLIEKLPRTFAAAIPIGGRPDVKSFDAFQGTSVWISHNTGDPTVRWSGADQGAKAIEQAIDTSFKRFDVSVPEFDDVADGKYVFTQPELEHHDAWTDVYTSEVFYRWLLQQKLGD